MVKVCIGIFSELQEYKTAEKFVPKLTNTNNKIIALVTCQKLKAAYLLAVKEKNTKMIDYIRDEASRQDQRGVVDLCQKYLDLPEASRNY